MLISSRSKFTKTSISKIDIDIINQEFLFWLCPMKLSIEHDSLILKHKSSKSQKEKMLRPEEKQYSVKLHDSFFVFHVGWAYMLRGSLSIKVVSQWIKATRNLLQCYPIFNISSFFQCWKKVTKMNTFVHPTHVYPT